MWWSKGTSFVLWNVSQSPLGSLRYSPVLNRMLLRHFETFWQHTHCVIVMFCRFTVPVATVSQMCVVARGKIAYNFDLWHTFILVALDEASSVGQMLMKCVSQQVNALQKQHKTKRILSWSVEGSSCHRMTVRVVLKRVAAWIHGDAHYPVIEGSCSLCWNLFPQTTHFWNKANGIRSHSPGWLLQQEQSSAKESHHILGDT